MNEWISGFWRQSRLTNTNATTMCISCLSWASVVPLPSHCLHPHHRWGWDNKHYNSHWTTNFITCRLPPVFKNSTCLLQCLILMSLHCSVTQSCPTLCWPHWLQHTRLPCPSPSPRVCSNSCPVSWWCHPTISLFSVVPFSSCLQSFPASGSFPMNRLFASGDQSIGASASASVLPMNIQGWFPLGLMWPLGLTGPCCPRHTTFKYLIWGFIFLFLFSSPAPPSAIPLSWQDLSSLITDQTQPQQWQHQVLTSGPPGNSQYLLIFI